MRGGIVNDEILKEFRKDLEKTASNHQKVSWNTLSSLLTQIAVSYKNGDEEDIRKLFKSKEKVEKILMGGERAAYSIASGIFERWISENISKEDFIKLMGHGRRIVKILEKTRNKNQNKYQNNESRGSRVNEGRPRKATFGSPGNSKFQSQLKKIRDKFS